MRITDRNRYLRELYNEINGAMQIGVYDDVWKQKLLESLREIPYEGRDKASILQSAFDEVKRRLNHAGNGLNP